MLWGRTVIDTVRFFSEKRYRPVSVPVGVPAYGRYSSGRDRVVMDGSPYRIRVRGKGSSGFRRKNEWRKQLCVCRRVKNWYSYW